MTAPAPEPAANCGTGRDPTPVGVPEIETLSTREVYRNRWLVLREDAIRRADGSLGIHAVVDKSRSALVVPRHDDGSFTLVEQYRYTVGARRTEFPQGSWEARPDADGLTVAAGELAEETGLVAARLQPIGTLHHAYGYSGQACTVVLATGLVEGPSRREVEEQGMTTRQVTRDELDLLVVRGEVTDAATLGALALLDLHDRGYG